MTRLDWGLDWLLNPVIRTDFADQNWGRTTLKVQRLDPAYFTSVLSLSDVDKILTETVPRHPNIRVVKQGQGHRLSTQSENDVDIGTSAENVFSEYRKGATIILQFLGERWPSLGQLTEALSHDLGARVQANVYLTPAGSQGFNCHADTHDVFIIQISGSKRWRLYADDKQKTDEFVLHAGDLLYIPQGQLHDAETEDQTSLHITLGVHAMTWSKLFTLAVERVVQAEPAFSASLPLGFVNDDEARKQAEDVMSKLRKDLVAGLSPEATIGAAAELVLASKRPDLNGHLLDLEAVDQVDENTTVRPRKLEHDLNASDDAVKLTFHGKTVTFPAHLLLQVQFICKAETFCARDLPGNLDPDGRIVLISELLREGFLTLA